MRSLTIAELSLGDSAEFRKTISESDVYLFAGITGDLNPVHVDAEFAKDTPFGARVAHGPLTGTLVAHDARRQQPDRVSVSVVLDRSDHD